MAEGSLVEQMRAQMKAHLEAGADALVAARAEPFVTGSRGQLGEHPGFTIAARSHDVAVRFARQLRIAGESVEEPDENPFDALAARRRSNG
jgi:hypothetical protein